MDAYEVGVRVSLTDGVSAGLMRLIGRFKSAELGAAGLQKELRGIQTTMIAGAAMTAVGIGMVAMFKPAIEQAKKFQVETAKFRQFGLGDVMTEQAVKFAKASNQIGTSNVEMFRLINESQGIFKDSGMSSPADQFRGAQLAAPMLARMRFIEKALGGRENSAADDRSFLRVVEMLGGVRNPETFNSIADRVFKLQMSSGGTVNSELLRQFIATGGNAVKTMTGNALYGESEPLLAELKSRAGTGLATAFASMSGILKPSQQRLDAIEEFGLWDRSKYQRNGLGGLKHMNGMPMLDQAAFQADPYQWYEKYVRSKYDAKGFTQAQRDFENSMLFGRTGGALFSLVDRQWQNPDGSPGVMQKAAIAQNKALGIDQMSKIAGGTLAGQQIDMGAKFRSLLEKTGEVALPIAVKVLEALLPVLTSISNFATSHPNMFGFIIDGIIGLGAVLTVTGVATLLAGFGRAVGLAFKIFTPLARSLSVWNDLGVAAARLPLIGDALSGIMLTVGTLTLPEWGTIAAVAAGILVAGKGLVEFVKHWDTSKSALTNLKSEWSTFVGWASDLVRNHTTGKIGPVGTAAAGAVYGSMGYAFSGTKLNALLYQWRMDFEKAFMAQMRPSIAAMTKIWDGLKSAFNALVGWFSDKIKWLRSLLPKSLAATPKPTVTAPKAHTGLTPWTAKDWGNTLGFYANKLFAGNSTVQTASAVMSALNKGTSASAHQAATLATAHGKLAGSEDHLSKAIDGLSSRIAAIGMPPKAGQSTEVHTTVHLDGHKIAKVVSKHQATGLSGPRAGTARFDPNTGLAASGAGYGH